MAILQSSNMSKVTVITSSIKGEGKSVVAANLAYALARDMGKMTLLIDGDLKCPTIHQYFGVSQSPGVRDVLQGSQSLESCLRQEGELSLWILPSGVNRSRALDNLSKIKRIGGILEDLKKRFEHIIIDAPPVLPLADMHVIASMADTVVLVIRAGLTPRNVVASALGTLGTTSNTCIILNELEASGVPYYMQEGYEYFPEGKEAGLR
jgi:capsular exopolysaccharide synthesis family protein